MQYNISTFQLTKQGGSLSFSLHSIGCCSGGWGDYVVFSGSEQEKLIFQVWHHLHKPPSFSVKCPHWAAATPVLLFDFFMPILYGLHSQTYYLT